jgi:hypothetical protein
MKRALVLAEGDTEERFIKEVLRGYFWGLGLDLAPTLLTTKRVKSGGSFRGGVTSFGKFENDARRLLGSCGGALVTTMLDYYGLPSDFPGMDSRPAGDPLVRVLHVEAAIKAHYREHTNFLPYLSLHEFESLLFASKDELPKALTTPTKAVEFAAIRAGFKTPEDINERPGHSPSSRIAALFPAYRKKFHGPTAARRIGLDVLRCECPHFRGWIRALESFAAGN